MWMSSHTPPFPNLTFKTVFTSSLFFDHVKDSESLTSHIVAAFAVTSTSFYNSSLQANVVSRVKIDDKSMKLFELFLHPPSTTTTTSSNLSTIQLTPVLNMRNLPPADIIIKRLKDSTYFSRSLRRLTVDYFGPNSLLLALDNLVALEVLDLSIYCDNSTAICHEFSVISRLPSLFELKIGLEEIRDDECGCFDFLGDLENNNGFRKLSVDLFCENAHKDFEASLARLCAKNLLTHLALNYYFTDDDLDVLIDAKLANLQSLKLTGKAAASPSKIADAIIASSSSLTSLEVDNVWDDELIKCAEYFGKLVELRIGSRSINGSFLREKGSCFASKLEILEISWSYLADVPLQDGFKHLTSLRKLDLSCSEYFGGAETLQHLTAASSLEELKFGTITSASLKAVGQLTQLRWLHVGEVNRDLKRNDVAPLKNLVNLRKLTVECSCVEMYQGILKVADSFPELEYVKLGRDPSRKAKTKQFSRDEVTYLLEKCWPLVRYAEFACGDDPALRPYLRRRFPHVNFGYAAERSVPVIREIPHSCSNKSQVDNEDGC